VQLIGKFAYGIMRSAPWPIPNGDLRHPRLPQLRRAIFVQVVESSDGFKWRNLERFRPDFMFQLTADEADGLRFQFGTLKRGQHFKYLPRAISREKKVTTHNGQGCDMPAASAVDSGH
jgi:hypothetical protein